MSRKGKYGVISQRSKSARERDKDAEFKFILDRSQPIVEAILQPTDENCGEGVVEGSVAEMADASGLSLDADRHGSSTLPAPTDDKALATLDPGSLTFELEALRNKPLSLLVVAEAKELDSKLKVFLEQAEQSPTREKIKDLDKQHKYWLGLFNQSVDPIKKGREFLSGLFATWERKRKAEVDEQRRKDEAAAKAQQEAERAADVAHLKVLGHKEDAKRLAAAPLPPVVLPEPKNPPGKLSGVTVIPIWKLDPLNPVKDYRALYHYIADHPELWYHQELSPSRWKRTLTDSKGKTEIPGINVIEGTETRNRG